MNLQPTKYNRIRFSSHSCKFDLELLTNLTYITSKSGTGKSFLAYNIRSWAAENDDIVVYDYENRPKNGLSEQLKDITGKLIVIDNSDILLSRSDKQRISFDTKNQYIIIGRDFEDFVLLTRENFCGILFKDGTLSLEYD